MDRLIVEEVRAGVRLSGLIRPHTKLRPASGGFIGLCPFHKERTPSFHVSDQRGTYKCFGCGAWGDCFDFIMQTQAISFQDALEQLQRSPQTGAFTGRYMTQTDRETVVSEEEKRRIAHAHEAWLKRAPIGGTLAEDYLRKTRGIMSHIPEILGFVERSYCSVLREETAALVAPIQDSAGHVTAVQQIYLCSETLDAWRDEDGRRVKRTMGVMRDGCVRLGLPDETLGLAGSVEDALAAASLFSLPVWATCGEARLERVWVPPEITRLVVFADADEPGMRAAKACARRHWGKREVLIHEPSEGKDWCSVAMQRNAA